MLRLRTITSTLLVAALAVAAASCAKPTPDVGTAPSSPSSDSPSSAAVPPTPAGVAPGPPEVVSAPAPVPVREEAVTASSLDDLNRASPLQPVFFAFDSSEIDAAAQATLSQNAAVLKKHASWIVTIEGHCDESGTAEYNLALGERRAVAARAYLTSLGIQASQFQIVSYGKEFPFEPGHNDAAWAKNRRAHFVITGQ